MQSDLSSQSLIVPILATIPAILLALGALWRVIRSEARLDRVEAEQSEERASLVRKLVQDAWQEGRLAGIREYSALLTPSPPAGPPAPNSGG